MADIDVGVLYLAVPPQTAPKTTYSPAVRVRNNGIHARVASGYIRVYDKDTGLLVHSFGVVSPELDPGQEGNAVASTTWDLTEAVVGKQYVVSGWCSCAGDMDPSNNVLDSSIITVAETPPPPPPPVEPHASQHEDGGDDQINLDGLHGQPADPQPYANHAAKHMTDGDDQISIAGLAGQAADPQIPTSHGNERHVVPFATSSELGSHEADTNTHEVAENLEQTANKGRAGGYPELDGDSKVPVAQLPEVPPTVHGAELHDSSVEAIANKGVANGYVGLDADAFVDPLRLAPDPSSVLFLRGDRKWEVLSYGPHKVRHQAGGDDEIAVTLLAGADPIPFLVTGTGELDEVAVANGTEPVIYSVSPEFSAAALRITASVDVAFLWRAEAASIYAFCRIGIEDQSGITHTRGAFILPQTRCVVNTRLSLHALVTLPAPALPVIRVFVEIFNHSGGMVYVTPQNIMIYQHIDPAV